MHRAPILMRRAPALTAALRTALTATTLTVTALTVTGFGFSDTAFAIAGGEAAPVGAYRFATKLTMIGIPRVDGTTYDSACSGALITPMWIITAGHCFHSAVRADSSYDRVEGSIRPDGAGGVPYRAATATIGRHSTELDPNGAPKDTSGHVVTITEAYQSPIDDVALARLATPVDDISPLSLSSETPPIGSVLRITGWGKTDPKQTGPYPVLQTGQVTVAKVSETKVVVRGYRPLPTTSACSYDSGAPYFSEAHGTPQLVSIEQSGPTCPHGQLETTGRIEANLPWISIVLNQR